MLNKIWPIFIIISIIYSFLSGNIEKVNNEIFSSAKNAVELCITFFGTICLWNGIMQIALKSNMVEKLIKLFDPIIKKLFPEIKDNKKIKKEISMNIIANIMGLGNAATPAGIKAMESLQEINSDKNKLSNSMMLFIIINTASLQIIPTTVIAIRSSLNSENPTLVIFPIWCASIFSVLTGVLLIKKIIKKENKK